MKTKARILSSCLILLALISTTYAQVGIGVSTPHAKAILDLTNTNSKGLLLPILSAAPSSTSGPEAMIFYYDSNIYLRDAVGFNAITPWKYKYNGSTSEVVTFNPASYGGVGIGIQASALKGNLHVSLNSKDVNVSNTSAAIFVGNSDSGVHLEIDNDEIMVKTNATTAGTLKLQEGGGTVQVGQSITNTSTLNVYGKVKEHGNDLVPAGVVVMWSGSLATIPAGWALCDGQKYIINTTTGVTEVNASGATTPDLRERFIVGAGSSDNATVTGSTQYAPGAGGNGNNFITLTASQCAMPSHVHSINHGHGVTDPGHKHDYSLGDSGNSCSVPDDTGGYECTKSVSTETTGLTVNNHVGNSGSATVATASSSHENRPPYYALAFIMKL